MNAANERAVSAFLDRRIRFLDIPNVVAETLERMDRTADPPHSTATPSRAPSTDAAARRVADEVVGDLAAA